ncbi:RagB/SusD family nutrient uptake outer membrane protein [Sphingobacterium detergens]|uniref:SusD-like starch-binding protein associating with outer membrane n=1 Tax=Sphingobacterium detergens TaxID=1145106 RepID=A0A420AQJ2_SPHD1|nr:RagB/SusD family nutrient uptake outer membrane protein [Sphingobacterium detergens]RKE46732.1 SusD-like starch-binding protein associating with outer membrane [Sphingobacterium detergens]
MMQKFRHKIIVICGLIGVVALNSCKKWVNDTEQPLEVDESKVFSSERGFREALNGIYLQMGAETLYGKELTFGVVSLAGRNYDSVSMQKSGELYYQSATLNLNAPPVKTYSSTVWTKMYSAILNANNVLENIDGKKEIFTADNYRNLKGEALALRAYLHFDLLRLFSSVELQDRGVPYVTKVSHQSTDAASVEVALDHCISDLNEADSLLGADSPTTSQLNKWAVKGLLARIYMYKNDRTNAYKYAAEVINSGKFALTVKSNADLFFASESLFKLYIYANNYNSYYKSFFGVPALIGLSVSSQNALFGSPTTDYRRNFIDVTTGSLSGIPILPKKFTATGANIFPMIRLSEMYFIAAECSGDITQALGYINLVREARNLAPLTEIDIATADKLSFQLQSEYRKEFLAEGQSFFYYKRNRTPFSSLPFYPTTPPVIGQSNLEVADEATYVFSRP